MSTIETCAATLRAAENDTRALLRILDSGLITQADRVVIEEVRQRLQAQQVPFDRLTFVRNETQIEERQQ